MVAPVEPLVALDWLLQHQNDFNLLILDLQLPNNNGKEAYSEAHIPGALYSDYGADGWRSPTGAAPPAGEIARLLSRFGISPDTHVILSPKGEYVGDLAAACRLYWTMKWVGHDRVSILEGGTSAWFAAKPPLPKEKGWRQPVALARPYPIRPRPSLRAEAYSVETALENQTMALVDARSEAYFLGKEIAPNITRGGHIPGAYLLDFASNFDEKTHKLQPKHILEQLFKNIPSKNVIHYCNTGHSAALNWFVFSEILEHPQTALYDGSMRDWVRDETHPVVSNKS